jgi:hypothetical protein
LEPRREQLCVILFPAELQKQIRCCCWELTREEQEKQLERDESFSHKSGRDLNICVRTLKITAVNKETAHFFYEMSKIKKGFG